MEPDEHIEDPDAIPRETNLTIPTKEFEKRFQNLVRILDQMIVSDYCRNDNGTSIFGTFLISVVDEFRRESKKKSKKNDFLITDHERLLFMRKVILLLAILHSLLSSDIG